MAAPSCEIEAAESSPHLFVDAKSKITYQLLNGSQLYIEEELIATVNATDDPNLIAVTKGESGFKDDHVWRSSGPVSSAPNTGDWFSVARLHGEQLSITDFQDRYPASSVVHIKGFGAGISTVYDNVIMDDLRKFHVLVWDGDDYEEDGFTKLVPMFLDCNSSGVAVAFKNRFEIPKFNSRWAGWMAKYPQRIKVVPIDYPEDAVSNGVEAEKDKYVSALPAWAQEYFALGRCASKATGSKQVVALGGGGIAGNEAHAGFAENVHWTIYALSRGKKEAHPALCDFAHDNKSNEFIRFVTGKDPQESDAFHVAPGEAEDNTDAYAEGFKEREHILERKKRLRELEAMLHAQAGITVEPQLRSALGRVEEALAKAKVISPLVEDRELSSGKKALSVPKLHLAGSQPIANAAPLSARTTNAGSGVNNGTNVKPPLSARGSSRDSASRRIASNSGANLAGVNPWYSTGMTQQTSSPSSPRLSSQFSPRTSVQSPRSRSSLGFQPAARRSKLSAIASLTRSPTTSVLCKEIEELMTAVPARYADALESVFVRLLGDMNAFDLRYASQTKVGEELQSKLGRSPSTGASQQRLRESEETYRRHIERLAARDRLKAVRAAETMQLSGKEGQLIAEVTSLREERIRALKHQRAAKQAISEQEDKTRAQIARLSAQIDAKRNVVQRGLEGMMPAARRVYDEQSALRRRIDKLRL